MLDTPGDIDFSYSLVGKIESLAENLELMGFFTSFSWQSLLPEYAS